MRNGQQQVERLVLGCGQKFSCSWFSIQDFHKVGLVIQTSNHFLMKALFFGALFCAFALNVPAQNQGTNTEPPQDTPFIIVQRDGNANTWQRTTYEQMPSGEWIPHLHSYQETATGLNFKNPDTGEWEASSGEIEIVQGGAVARHGQHKIIFAADLATYGAIDMETPDGQRLRSHMLGLCYFDQASGKSVFIAEVTNSIGQLISSNQVWYDNAFTGLKAGVRYSYTREGFEQDIILEEQPPVPESYGLNSSTTVLQAYTEFISPPAPAISMSVINEGTGQQMLDKALTFSTMKIGRGRAFLAATSSENIPVAKDWATLEGRQFLIEQVPIPQITEQLDTLPPPQASVRQSNSVLNVVSSKRLLPGSPLAKVGTNQMRLASLPHKTDGFVLDYISLNTSQTNYTFRGDMTYYISGNVNLYGTNTTFEGGTVVKYNSGVSLSVYSPVTWGGSTYHPVVLLSKDDTSIGETVSFGSPGNSYYATKALYFDGTTAMTNLVIDNLRILNAQTGIAINGRTNHLLSNVQITKCGNGVLATNADFCLRNALFSSVLTNFNGSSGTGHVEHLTSDVGSWLNKDVATNLFLTNCILSTITNLGNCVTQSVAVVSSGAGVFQTVGAGAYYLTNGTSYRDAGTTNINSTLLAQLARKTTYPPIQILNSNINVLTTLGPAVQRDYDTPDLGYHYDPLDYVLSGVNVNTNLTVLPGTAIGWFKPGSPIWAVHLADKTVIEFNGTFEAPDYFVRTSTAQEGNTGWGTGLSGFGIEGSQNESTANVSLASEIHMNFTTMTGFVGWDQQFRDDTGYLIVRANNSTLTGGNVVGYDISLYLTNCLMDNQQVGTIKGIAGNEVYLRNCTLHNGYFYGQRLSGIPITVQNCAFEGIQVYTFESSAYSTNSAITYYNFNAYTNSVDPFPNPLGITNDQKSVTFTWQTGPAGKFYLPANSVLINSGSTNANLLGLYHFTTQINQVKETNSLVDIGYHYIALDNFGNAMDSDGDGAADYVEDVNGNGLVNSGETDWQSASDSGLRVLISRPRPNSLTP